MRNIGEKVVLNGKTYEITGYHKKSYLLKIEGGTMVYKCGPAKLERMLAGIPRAVHRRSSAQQASLAVPAYITRQIEFNKLWRGRGGSAADLKLPETEAEIMQWFSRLCGELSPENLCCDGELSGAPLAQKKRELDAAWRYLEGKLGRKMTEDEVYAREMRNERSL